MPLMLIFFTNSSFMPVLYILRTFTLYIYNVTLVVVVFIVIISLSMITSLSVKAQNLPVPQTLSTINCFGIYGHHYHSTETADCHGWLVVINTSSCISLYPRHNDVVNVSVISVSVTVLILLD